VHRAQDHKSRYDNNTLITGYTFNIYAIVTFNYILIVTPSLTQLGQSTKVYWMNVMLWRISLLVLAQAAHTNTSARCVIMHEAFRYYWWQLPVREGSSWSEEPLQNPGTAPVGELHTTASPCRRHSPATPKTATSARLGHDRSRETAGSACLLSKRQAKPFRISLSYSHNGRHWMTLLWLSVVLILQFWKLRATLILG